MALEGGEGGTWASTFFLVRAAGLIEFLTQYSLLCGK